jgi:hypothetical protein
VNIFQLVARPVKDEDDRSGLLGHLMSLGARPANPPPNGQAQRVQRDSSSAAPHGKNWKPYTVWCDVRSIKQVKQLALDTGMTQQNLMVMVANDLFKRFDKPPIAI